MTEKEEESYASLISETIEEEWSQLWGADWNDYGKDAMFLISKNVSQRLVPKIELQVLEEISQALKTKPLFVADDPIWLDRQEVLDFLERKMAERKPK